MLTRNEFPYWENFDNVKKETCHKDIVMSDMKAG